MAREVTTKEKESPLTDEGMKLMATQKWVRK